MDTYKRGYEVYLSSAKKLEEMMGGSQLLGQTARVWGRLGNVVQMMAMEADGAIVAAELRDVAKTASALAERIEGCEIARREVEMVEQERREDDALLARLVVAGLVHLNEAASSATDRDLRLTTLARVINVALFYARDARNVEVTPKKIGFLVRKAIGLRTARATSKGRGYEVVYDREGFEAARERLGVTDELIAEVGRADRG